MIGLRDYQTDAINKVLAARRRGIGRSLVSLPTGAGKTVVFSALARKLNIRTLILAHRDELLKQAAEKLDIVWPDAQIGFVKAKQNDFAAQIVVASVQTLASPKRLEQIARQDFGLLIIDEAHHAVSPTYKRVIKRLGFMDGDPTRLLVGVTATAARADGAALGDVFQETVCHISMLSLMREDYLSDIKAYRVQTDVDLSGVHSRGGDFVDWELSRVVNTPTRNNLVADKYLEYATGRKAIAFCVDVQHSHDLAAAFLARGITAKALSGATPPDERKEALEAFGRGDIQVLTNCNLLTEGFDEPSVGCVLMARPTKSQSLYIQCVGRGTRPAPGKENCIVMDFTEGTAHDVCLIPSLFGIPKEQMESGATVVQTVRDVERQRITEQKIKDVTVQEVDLLGRSRFAWFQIGAEWRLLIKHRTYVVLLPCGGKYIVQRSSPNGVSVLHDKPLPIGFAQGLAEDYAREHGNNLAMRDAKWRNDRATPKQIDLLQRLGVSVPNRLSKGDASLMIDKAMASKHSMRLRVM